MAGPERSSSSSEAVRATELGGRRAVALSHLARPGREEYPLAVPHNAPQGSPPGALVFLSARLVYSM